MTKKHKRLPAEIWKIILDFIFVEETTGKKGDEHNFYAIEWGSTSNSARVDYNKIKSLSKWFLEEPLKNTHKHFLFLQNIKIFPKPFLEYLNLPQQQRLVKTLEDAFTKGFPPFKKEIDDIKYPSYTLG
jgi:hypothetical protein